MICLMLWGGRLEKQIGHLYFLLIYLFSLIAGALVTDFSQSRDYLTVGASGATSELLGALLFLGLFGKVALSAGFFVVNIGLNVALAASSSRINWAAHLGGFAAGLIGCALLDGIERANGYLLRCKFPEFVKLNGFAIVGVGAAILLGTRSPVPFSSGFGTQVLAAFAIVSLIGIKLIDLLLSMRNGLAVIAVLLAIANAALVLLWSRIFPSAATHTCEVVVMALHLLTAYVCANSMMPIPVAILVLIASLLISWANLVRGLADVGFVGNTLRGERARRNGL